MLFGYKQSVIDSDSGNAG